MVHTQSISRKIGSVLLKILHYITGIMNISENKHLISKLKKNLLLNQLYFYKYFFYKIFLQSIEHLSLNTKWPQEKMSKLEFRQNLQVLKKSREKCDSVRTGVVFAANKTLLYDLSVAHKQLSSSITQTLSSAHW